MKKYKALDEIRYEKNLKKARIEIAEWLYETIEEKLDSFKTVYEKTDILIQQWRYKYENGQMLRDEDNRPIKEYLTDENGQPLMENKYDYVTKEYNDLPEENQLKIDACIEALNLIYNNLM